MVVFSFLLTICFWPGISGGATTPRWALMSVGIPILLLYRRIPLTVAHLIGLLFVVWAGVTLIWTPNVYFGLNAYLQILLMAGAFLLGSSLKTLRPVLIALGVGFSINSVLVLMQGLYWNPFHYLETPGNPSVVATFINGNLLAECAALTAIGLAAYRVWWLLPPLIPSILLPFTNGTPRAPLLAIAVAALVWLWPKRPIVALHIAGLCVIGGIALIGGHNDSMGQRYNFWADTLRGITPFGHGIGSFYLTFPEFSAHSNTLISRPENAHNDWLEYIYELGLGVIPLVYVLGFALRSRRMPERLVLIGLITEAAVGFPLHMPAGQWVAAITVGCLCGDRYGVRCSFALGGIRVRPWLARLSLGGGSRGPPGKSAEVVPLFPEVRARSS